MKKCAFDRDNTCTALTKKQCLGCKFRKTEEELREGRQKVAERLDSLPERQQIHIARKYYNVEWTNDQNRKSLL